MTSFTNETAPTPEKAMELGKEIFKPITDAHISVIGTHFKEREKCSYHDHVIIIRLIFITVQCCTVIIQLTSHWLSVWLILQDNLLSLL